MCVISYLLCFSFFAFFRVLLQANRYMHRWLGRGPVEGLISSIKQERKAMMHKRGNAVVSTNCNEKRC